MKKVNVRSDATGTSAYTVITAGNKELDAERIKDEKSDKQKQPIAPTKTI